MRQLPYNPRLQARARELRRAGMLHEVLLWQQLKGRQLHGLNFDRQKVIGNYIVDFYCADRQTVIELDGSSHDDKVEYDRQREQYLTALGLQVLHFTARDVLRNLAGVLDGLRQHPRLQPAER
jgi:very-short-patch-repair endonuclease